MLCCSTFMHFASADLPAATEHGVPSPYRTQLQCIPGCVDVVSRKVSKSLTHLLRTI